MPGLLRGMARTAVVAGTATAVSNRVSRRQASRWGYADEPQQQGYQEEPAYQQAPPPPPPAAPSNDPVERLNELAHLRNQGLLTDEEFSAAKAKLLA
jgi:hypothetical protein